MKTILRSLAGVVAGLFVLFLLVVAVEMFSAVVHPIPEYFEGTMEEMCEHVANYPPWVLAVVVPLWAIAALAGTWTAQRVGNVYAAVIVGVLLLAGLVCNISMLPYPLWFKIANLMAIPSAVFAGLRLSRRHTTADVGESN